MGRQPEGTPGLAGIVWIIIAVLFVSLIITMVTGHIGHWLFILLSLVVGLWSVQSVNGK